MRTSAEIKDQVLHFARHDHRVRAVLLNGSRANPNSLLDELQDFDLVFVVTDVASFTTDHAWTDVFGAKIIMQLPDEMGLYDSDNHSKKETFTYLMLFGDRNRIDLTLLPVQKTGPAYQPDSLTVLWLDKDGLFTALPPPTDSDYFVRKPSEKDFLAACNEFWWVSTYVAKGLLRDEIMYAKAMLETVVRPMFLKVMEWQVAIRHNFGVSCGKSGRFLKNYLPPDLYQKVLQTYSGYETAENWKALLLLAELFQEASRFVAEKLGFGINKTEEQATIAYLKALHAEQQATAGENAVAGRINPAQHRP